MAAAVADAGSPDLAIACFLLLVFLRSALRVLRSARDARRLELGRA